MTLFPNKVTFGGSGKGKCSVTPVTAGASSRHPGLVTTTLDSADYRKCPSVHGVPVDIVTGLSPWEDVHGKCSERSRGRSLARWTTSPCPQNRSPVILLCHGPTHHPAPLHPSTGSKHPQSILCRVSVLVELVYTAEIRGVRPRRRGPCPVWPQ